MRLGILGIDRTALDVARAVTLGDRHRLVWLCRSDAEDQLAWDALRELAPYARVTENWETLLDADLVDAVFVARSGHEDRRAEQLRMFVQAAMPVLVAHPAFGSMLVYYELDMIRRESEGVVRPYLPWRWHPAVVALREMAQTDPSLGRVEQVLFERHGGARSRTEVVDQFARDVDVIRGLCGDVTRVGAMAAAAEDAAYANLGVQMSGPGAVLGRWSIGPPAPAESGRLTLLGSSGKAVVHIPVDDGPWTLELTGAGQSNVRTFERWNPAAAALDQLERAVAGETVVPDWIDACRSIELAETIERSLQKGRTVELHYEDYTEAGTFKGTMTSLGCALLIAAPVLLLFVALADQLGAPRIAAWPYLLLGILGVFLLLQLLMLVFARDERDKTPREP